MYLVTGAAGFIGFHISLYLLQNNKKVIGIDNLSSYYDTQLKLDRLNQLKKYRRFIFYKIDLSKRSKLLNIHKYLNKAEYVIHLAGQAGVRYSIKNPQTYLKNNIQAYLNILEVFKSKKKLKLILYASSSSIFGDYNKKNLKQPESFYAVTKKTMEDMSSIYNKIYKINIIGLRFFTVYGPWGRPDMSIYKFTNKIESNVGIEVFNSGDHMRSFTYISDVIDNIQLIINKFSKKNINICDVFNIGNPKSIKLNKMIKILEKEINKKSKKIFTNKQLGDVDNTKANIRREIKIYNSKYKVDLEDGIKKFYEWFLSYKRKN
tara:strand:+ start:699 stop:1655 length:957 start_codon:yes stop_codon:yes gene_type:complete